MGGQVFSILKTIGLKHAILRSQQAGATEAEAGRKNELANAQLCGCLDDKKLVLILYEAPDVGKKSK